MSFIPAFLTAYGISSNDLLVVGWICRLCWLSVAPWPQALAQFPTFVDECSDSILHTSWFRQATLLEVSYFLRQHCNLREI